MLFPHQGCVRLFSLAAGKPHDTVAIQRWEIEGALNRYNAAPIAGMRRYAVLKKKEQKVPDNIGCHPASLSWAREYLGGDFDIALTANKSIAGACAEKMNKMAWTAGIKNHLARESGPHKRGSDTKDRRLNERAMHSRNVNGSELESGGTALNDDDDLPNPVDHRRLLSPALTTNES